MDNGWASAALRRARARRQLQPVVRWLFLIISCDVPVIWERLLCGYNYNFAAMSPEYRRVLYVDWQTTFLEHTAYAAVGEKSLEVTMMVAPKCRFHEANTNPASVLGKWGNRIYDDHLPGHTQCFFEDTNLLRPG